MDELMGEFVAETRDTLEQIAEALVVWEAQPQDNARLDEIFRFVHTVKGSCGFLDLPRIEALAHAAETALAGVRDGTRTADGSLVGTMLSIIDRIGLLVSTLEDGKDAHLPDIAGDIVLIEALDRRTAVVDAFEPGVTRQARTVRIAVPLLESMMNQVSELVLVRNELARRLRDVGDQNLDQSFGRLTGIVGELRDSVTRTRMQPIDRLFATLPRLVRDTANEVGKSVTLDISGQDVEIDREMVEAIRDPLIHIVRNAIDHGLESGPDRLARGKPETGSLRVVAMQSGNQVSIEISDDGRGIDTAALVRKAIEQKRLDLPQAAQFGEARAAELIFEAGLSTAEHVTSISGRGVGMDVVRANVERLGGSVALVNRPGLGLSITIRAPLTLSIVNALVVSAGGQSFAIPRGAIEEVVALGKGQARLERVGGGLVAVVRGTATPAFGLAALLGMAGAEPVLGIVVGTPGNGRYTLAVDSVSDHEELVVRPMAAQLATRGIFAGQSLGDDGRPVMVLDPVGLAILGGLVRSADITALQLPEVAARPPSIVLATTLDGRRVAVRAAIVERLIDTQRSDWTQVGDAQFVVVDGRHHSAVVHGDLPQQARISALLLYDGSRRSVLPVAEVHDLIPLPEIAPVHSNGTEGLIQFEGESVVLLEGMTLFSGSLPAAGARPIATLALDPSPWARALLAPLVEAAGYDVRFGDVEGAALVLTLDGDTVSSGKASADRYDRAALEGLIAQKARKSA